MTKVLSHSYISWPIFTFSIWICQHKITFFISSA